MPREELSHDIPLPTPQRKRQTAAEKAKTLLDESRASEAEVKAQAAGQGRGGEDSAAAPVAPSLTYKALTCRVFLDQHDWFCAVPKRWRIRHPRKPKLTREELMRIAIEHLRQHSEAELDALIERYRSS